MSDGKNFLLRKSTGDQMAGSEQELRDLFQRGQCKAADSVFDFSTQKWCRVGEHPALAALLGTKPGTLPEKRLVYYMLPGSVPMPQGPFSTKEFQLKAQQSREICATTWVFIDGDKEWRQVRAVKVLADMLPALPTDLPAGPAKPASAPAAPSPFALDLSTPPPAAPSKPAAAPAISSTGLDEPSSQTNPSIRIDMDALEEEPPRAPPSAASAPPAFKPGMAVPSAPAEAPPIDDDFPEREEATMAISTLGLASSDKPAAPEAPARRPAPLPGLPPAPGSVPPAAPPRAPQPIKGTNPSIPGITLGNMPPNNPPPAKSGDDFDGITAEIPMEPIWLVKPGTSEAVSGPFRFLEIVKFLEEGRLTKNDKISKVGTNRFVKILQQYEFNVKYSVETVIEHGMEKQKILIKRRHPRVPYLTDVQVVGRQGTFTGSCVNISMGGILLETKMDLALGEMLEIKLLPGLINRAISCKALVIGKIPKIPPGFALKFEDMKNEDKEAIEFFVQEMLKREM
jgi:hypothetical protein